VVRYFQCYRYYQLDPEYLESLSDRWVQYLRQLQSVRYYPSGHRMALEVLVDQSAQYYQLQLHQLSQCYQLLQWLRYFQ